MRKCYIFLPVYNEETAIRRVIERLEETFLKLRVPFHILALDDGSTDGSGEILNAFRERNHFTLLRHATNCGIHAVFRTGMEYLVNEASENDSMILMEADDTNDLACLPALLESLQDGAHLVIASRFVGGGEFLGFPLWRRIPCKAVNWMFRVLFSIENVTDYTIFFRGYSMKLLQKGVNTYGNRFIETVGFVANAEILLKLRVFNPSISEVPLVYRYDLKESRSKLKIPFTIMQYLKLIAAHLRRREVTSGS